MTDGSSDATGVVRCDCGPVKAEATYKIEDRFLVVDSPFGSIRTVLGVQKPKKLARRLLRDRCQKEASAVVQTERPPEPRPSPVL